MAKGCCDLEKEQVWRLRLEQQRKSGLNVRGFCRRESISEPSFYAWRRELKKRDAAKSSQARQESQPVKLAATRRRKLIPVEVVERSRILPRADQSHNDNIVECSESLRTMPQVELVTPGGWRLRFAASIEPAQLRTVPEVIGGHESIVRTESDARTKSDTQAEPIAC